MLDAEKVSRHLNLEKESLGAVLFLEAVSLVSFFFKDNSGEIFGLLDPTDPTRSSGSGIARYLYSKEELTQMLNSDGFEVVEIPH